MTEFNKQFMLKAIDLAEDMLGKTSPNPAVGCVIAKDGEIISEAATSIGGSPHAEARALEIAGDKASEADLYVTLEPCSHKGKNPPCAEAIIAAGIKKVFVANKDPFFKVNGKGIQLLKSAKIEVIENFCEKEAHEVNKYFFTRIQKNRPYITIKIAASLDGKIALSTGDSKWITSEEARRYVHRLRARNEGILTGIGTVLADNPSLNCRLSGLEEFSPIKFIIDQKIQTPLESNVNQGKEVYLFSDQEASNPSKFKVIRVDKREDGRLNLELVFEEVAGLEVSSILVEAGQALVSDLIKYELVDEIHLITAPKILGGDGINFIGNLGLENLPENRFQITSSQKLGDDVLTIFKNNHAD